ncbi:hypothetical protein [Bacillus marinisedimentorum]|uniref:hypothetical protein n=1 Tax=Bacillus marinisedimentorum TaxID=1821260 RepID=UPI0007E08D7C|nr:hypothetical protein [Bacillus marinisedimentorum]
MNKYYKDQCPTWAENTQLEHDLILGDDSDSLLTSNLLTDMTNGKWDINYFYDFQDFYRHKKTELPLIGVDMAFSKNVRCFDNHVSKKFSHSQYNKYCMNMNLYKNISTENYYKKYPFSTLMMVMSYYNIPLPDSQIGKEIILAIDSAFKGHYTYKEHFKKIHTDWLTSLGFDSLVDTLNNRNPNYFYELQKHFGLNEKIYIDAEGHLQTGIDLEGIQNHLDWKLELPLQQFKLIKECVREGHRIGQKYIPDKSELVSLAFTSKNYVSYTHRG